MKAYIMRARGKTYLAFGQDAFAAATQVPAHHKEISVSQGILVTDKSVAFQVNTEFGGILLLDKDGKSLGGMPLRDEQSN